MILHYLDQQMQLESENWLEITVKKKLCLTVSQYPAKTAGHAACYVFFVIVSTHVSQVMKPRHGPATVAFPHRYAWRYHQPASTAPQLCCY